MATEKFTSTLGHPRPLCAGFDNARDFFDDAVLCGNPFGKRLNIKIVNMAHTREGRSSSSPAATNFETLKECSDNNYDAGAKIDTKHPIVVGLRVMLIDPEDLKN
jgi:hypothetical protein